MVLEAKQTLLGEGGSRSRCWWRLAGGPWGPRAPGQGWPPGSSGQAQQGTWAENMSWAGCHLVGSSCITDPQAHLGLPWSGGPSQDSSLSSLLPTFLHPAWPGAGILPTEPSMHPSFHPNSNWGTQRSPLTPALLKALGLKQWTLPSEGLTRSLLMAPQYRQSNPPHAKHAFDTPTLVPTPFLIF
jgi:hypothetical protein